MHSPPPPTLLLATDRWLPGRCAVTVGNFDGVHLGHAAIVGRLREAADQRSVPAAVLTFDPHPAVVLRPRAAPIPLSTPARRAELLGALGVDAVFVQPTDLRLTSLPPEAFFADVLRRNIGAVAVVEGEDFRFGVGRAGDVRLLADLCRREEIGFDVVPPVVSDGGPVSSSRIRGLIAAGLVAEANALLTAAYRIRGLVVAGAGRGRSIGFPTANLSSIATVVPAGGVYAGRVTAQGICERHPAAIHIGPNTTFGETATSIEVHLIGFEGDLYGRTVDVDFLERLRETRRFASVAELENQLGRDIAEAARIAIN